MTTVGRDNGAMPTRALLVEDDDFTRTTLSSALALHGIHVAGTARGAVEAMAASRSLDIDVAVLDLDLGPGPTGVDIAHGLRRAHPGIGIVLLTSFTDPRLLAASLSDLPQGAHYVVKQSLDSMEMLVAAIEGSTALSGGQPPESAATGLTSAQIDTLRLLAAGLSNAEIARVRVVTEKSVEQAIARTAKRLGVPVAPSTNQRVALAREYFRLTGATRYARAQ